MDVPQLTKSFVLLKHTTCIEVLPLGPVTYLFYKVLFKMYFYQGFYS